MQYIAKGKASVRLVEDSTPVAARGMLKAKGCDILIVDGVLVARYDAMAAGNKPYVAEGCIPLSYVASIEYDAKDSPFSDEFAKVIPKPKAEKPKA